MRVCPGLICLRFEVSGMGCDAVHSGRLPRFRGPGSVVGIATAYGLDGPGIESRWGEIFRTSPDRP